jgi:hypothetical protein
LRSFEFIPPQASRQAAHAQPQLHRAATGEYSSGAAATALSTTILKRYQKNARTFFMPTGRRQTPRKPRKVAFGNRGDKSGNAAAAIGKTTKYSYFKRLPIILSALAGFRL